MTAIETPTYTAERLAELKTLAEDSAAVLGNAKSAKRQETNQLMEDAERRINRDMAEKHNPAIGQYSMVATKATADYTEYLEGYKKHTDAPPFPLGTLFVEWQSTRHSDVLTPTENRARMEVFTRESAWPANQSNGRPQVGEYVLRLLKKDGSPGAKVLRLTVIFGRPGAMRIPRGWYPSGVNGEAVDKLRRDKEKAESQEKNNLLEFFKATVSNGNWAILSPDHELYAGGKYVDISYGRSYVDPSDKGFRFPSETAAQSVIDRFPLYLATSKTVHIENKEGQ